MCRKFLIVISILFLISLASNVSGVEETYFSLLEKAKSGDKTVDFKLLRFLYTETSSYDPYDKQAPEANRAMFDALDKKQYEDAIKYAKTILDKDYMNIDAHFVCKIAYRETGNQELSDFHSFMDDGLIKSILDSGDGKNPQTAYSVISVSEEYVILDVLGFKVNKQSLIGQGDSHYDQFEVLSKKDGESSMLFFNVDKPLKWLMKKTDGEHPRGTE